MYLPEKLPEIIAPLSPYHELAEAIRRGCLLRVRQAFGAYEDEAQAVCALGAVAIAINIKLEKVNGIIRALRSKFPVLNDLVEMPCEHVVAIGMVTVLDVIVHLNDSEHWTREHIADWLDSLDA